MLKLITVCHDKQYASRLIQSAEKHGWGLIIIETPWLGFGTKLIKTYEYLKEHPEVTHFVFADAFDVLVFGTPEEFERKNYIPEMMWVSCEKGCWPDASFAERYEKTDSPFKYLNSGLYYAPSKEFIRLLEKNMPEFSDDDQLHLTKMYFTDGIYLIRDTHQELFNSHSFITDGEYGYKNGRIQIMGSEPIFVHSNGRTLDPKLDELL